MLILALIALLAVSGCVQTFNSDAEWPAMRKGMIMVPVCPIHLTGLCIP